MAASVILRIAALVVSVIGVLAGVVFGAPGGAVSTWHTLLYFVLTIAAFALLNGVAEIIELLKSIRDKLK